MTSARALLVLLLAMLGLSAACSGGSGAAPTSPSATRNTPGPTGTTFTLTGTLTSTNGGQPVPGASLALSTGSTTSDASGHFTIGAPTGLGAELRLTITGASLVDRQMFVLPTTHAVAADAILQDGTFSLDYYRELVRNNLEQPGALLPIEHWTTSPHVFIPTVDDTGKTMDRSTLDGVASQIQMAVNEWTAGRYSAGIEFVSSVPATLATDQVSVTWQTTGDSQICGSAEVDGFHIWLDYTNKLCSCPASAVAPSTVMHEVGHLMGFWHTDDKNDEMYYQMTTCGKDLSPRERYHAAIAFARQNGNQDPDNDPGTNPSRRRGKPVVLP